jgi:hypothetical protein
MEVVGTRNDLCADVEELAPVQTKSAEMTTAFTDFTVIDRCVGLTALPLSGAVPQAAE